MIDTTSDCVVVTGAAGGMGKAIAEAFAAKGRSLVLCDLVPGPLETVAEALRDKVEVTTFAADITAADFPARLIAKLGARKIGVLAHAAGVSPSMADGKRIFEINLNATMRLVEAALPRMSPGGTAILIASNSAYLAARPMIDRAVRRALNGQSSLVMKLVLRSSNLAYSVSKRAVQLYAKQMSNRFGQAGARIVSLSPGIIDTDMGRLEQKSSPEMDKMVEVTASRRMGLAEEIASVVTFLASPEAGYVCGTDILVDGGMIAGIENAGGVMRLLRSRGPGPMAQPLP